MLGSNPDCHSPSEYAPPQLPTSQPLMLLLINQPLKPKELCVVEIVIQSVRDYSPVKLYFFIFLKIVSHCTAKDGLEISSVGDYRHDSPCLSFKTLLLLKGYLELSRWLNG